MCGIEKIIKKKLRYDPKSGKLFWNFIPEVTRHDKAFNTQYAGCQAGYLHTASGYIYVGIHGKHLRAHRVAWFLYYGVWPTDSIDHINRIRSDNRLINLRDVSRIDNQRNLPKATNNKSGHTGVCLRKETGKWKAQIQVDKRSVHLGYFETKEEAISARLAAENEFSFHKNHGKEVINAD